MDRLKQLVAFHEEDPDDSFVRFALAMEYIKLARLEEAKRVFKELVENDPEYVGTYYHLGKLYETLGDTSSALKIYREGIQVSTAASDQHSKAELQSAMLEAEGIGFD